MQSRNRNYTKKACEERHRDILEARFRQTVRAMGDNELKETATFVAERLDSTHARFIWVRDRLAYKVAVLKQELHTREQVSL